MVFNVPTRRELTSGERAIQHGLAIAAGIKAAKDLGNMPPNNPTLLTSLHKRASWLTATARMLSPALSANSR
ncbi:hypothetical protein ACLB1Q_17480 [Escherichia coli]